MSLHISERTLVFEVGRLKRHLNTQSQKSHCSQRVPTIILVASITAHRPGNHLHMNNYLMDVQNRKMLIASLKISR